MVYLSISILTNEKMFAQMGITGLLPMIKDTMRSKHIKSYAGKKIGIDGHGWIHSVLPAIAKDLYYDRPTSRHLSILSGRIRNLQDYGIIPIFIFDGDYYPSKEKTIIERREAREKIRKEVETCLKRKDVSKAEDLMKRCASITKDVINSIIQMLRVSKIEYFISPYEADAQLFYLQKIGYIDYIMTEDSDLIAYGATNILYKYSGSRVEEYNYSRFLARMDKFFVENILDICILSGCDYLNSIKGVGLMTAYKKLKETGNVPDFVRSIRNQNKEVPVSYIEMFQNAKIAFLHHIVYDPNLKRRMYLETPESNFEFLGSIDISPYTIDNIIIDRHFKPESVDNVSASIEMAEIDTPLEINSPYFDK